jgi:hypothetical protein
MIPNFEGMIELFWSRGMRDCRCRLLGEGLRLDAFEAWGIGNLDDKA